MPGELRTRELVDGVFIVTHQIDDNHGGWRADNYLRYQYKHFSRNKLQTLIDEGRIRLDRVGGAMAPAKLKASTVLYPGDLIRVLTEQTAEPPVDLEYKILYEDEHVLVIDKPGNLPVHPAGKFLFNTVLMHLRQERKDWIRPDRDFHLIHRLDRETSGVLLLAKGSEMAGLLVKQFRERQTEKKYWAVVRGVPAEDRFTVDADLGSAQSHIRLKMKAFPKGTGELDALTHFTVLERGRGVALVDCKLETGRQHQIRVHLSYVGHPIVGDKLYGDDDNIFLDFINSRTLSDETLDELSIERQALHSRYLRFYHDKLGRWMEIESPLPADMRTLLETQ